MDPPFRSGSVAIVTGASSGIGAEIAVQLVKNGLKVVGLARRIDRLNELKNKLQNEIGEFHPIQCDMTVEGDILSAFEWTKTNLGGVDLLVNNAGTTKVASISDGEVSDWKHLLELNVLGVLISTREAIKSMTERNVAGLIIQINSVAGHFVPITCPTGAYPATKHGVTALTETVRLELAAKKSPIRISSISPGVVIDTEIFEVAGYNKDSNYVELFNKCPPLKSIDIANAVLYLMSTPPNVNITELTIRPTGEVL